jgi:hypothetical protein
LNQENDINENAEIINIQSNVKKVKISNNVFTFWNSLCFNFCIINKRKKNFVRIISKIIYNKLSVEYLLKLSNNFEALKKKTLNNEEFENFAILGNRTIKEQMKDFNLS